MPPLHCPWSSLRSLALLATRSAAVLCVALIPDTLLCYVCLNSNVPPSPPQRLVLLATSSAAISCMLCQLFQSIVLSLVDFSLYSVTISFSHIFAEEKTVFTLHDATLAHAATVTSCVSDNCCFIDWCCKSKDGMMKHAHGLIYRDIQTLKLFDVGM